MKALTFWKYHGLGNDFILFNGLEELDSSDKSESLLKRLTPDHIQSLCNRHTGIGADGIIVALPVPGYDYRMVYYNADGQEAEMCGNGIRCLVAMLRDLGKDMAKVTILTGSGPVQAEALSNGLVRNTMPLPVFKGISGTPRPDNPNIINTIDVNHRSFNPVVLSVGNPHAVISERISLDELLIWGPLIEHHKRFPNRTNVEFIEVVGANKVKALIWERGVGRTLASGSGATASACAAAALGKVSTDEIIEVIMEGGILSVRIFPDFKEIWLQGPAEFVFQGVLSEKGGWHGLVS
jgi:diaminopimelate epimerase